MDPTLVLVLCIFMLACCASRCCCHCDHEDRNPGPGIPAAAQALLVVLLLAGVGVVTLLYGPFELLLLCGVLLIPATCVLLVCVIVSIVRALRTDTPAKPLASTIMPNPDPWANYPAPPDHWYVARVASPTPPPNGFRHTLTNAALVASVFAVVVPVGLGLLLVIQALSH